jgi:hypothetical protein
VNGYGKIKKAGRIKLKHGGNTMCSRMWILGLIAVFLMAFAGFALASPPVQPPVEGFGISTSCDVEVAGDFAEEDAFTWTYVADTMNEIVRTTWHDNWGFPLSSVDPMYLAPGGRAAEVRYLQELDSVDSSVTQFNKTFLAQSHGVPNLDVTKDFGYRASDASMIAVAEDEERVSLGIVAYGDKPVFQFPEVGHGRGLLAGGGGNGDPEQPGSDDMPSLCPWVSGPIPATNEFITAGSSISTTNQMVSHTDSDMTATVAPSLNHSISAEGDGTATASMRAQLMEGDNSVGADVTKRINPVTLESSYDYEFVIPDLISKTLYDEKTSASGVIDKFNKSMHYHSTIPQWQMPEPWYGVE